MEPLALALAFGLSMLLGAASIALGERTGLVDIPDGGHLKGHSGRPVPLGGVGVLVGLHAGLALLGVVDLGLVGATVLLWIVGIADDRVGLDPRVRLMAAGSAGLLLGLLQDPFPGWLTLSLYVIVVAVVVNSVNLFDGLDALAGSVGVVAAVGLALLAGLRGQGGAAASLVLAAALLGFLMWNLPPARLFLGDNGAYVVGAALAWSALRFSTGWAESVVAVAMIGAPLIDLGATVIRRVRADVPLFGGDRNHSYDRLHRSGQSVTAVAVVFTLVQILWTAWIIVFWMWLGDEMAALVGIATGVLVAAWLGLGTWRTMSSDATSG